MAQTLREPKILVVTPEVSFLPDRTGIPSQQMAARSGGLGDTSATLIHALYRLGVDVHVAMPNYRNIFRGNRERCFDGEQICRRQELPHERIHLAQDRSFYYHPKLFVDTGWENIKIALAFQREVINRILPEVRPDLVHCHDWLTGLIPAMARQYGIPCLFTLYHLNTVKVSLTCIEDRGIDAAAFWQNCYYTRMPVNYEETRHTNPADLLVSGVFAAHFANTVSPTFLRQIIQEPCDFIDGALKKELRSKSQTGCLSAIEHAPGPDFNPATDSALYRRYTPGDHYAAKLFNKLYLQEIFHLKLDSTAPLFFWPTRIGGGRRGCWLMIDVLPVLLERYLPEDLQIVFIADGDLREHIQGVINAHNAGDRIAVAEFEPRRYRLAYGAADFVLLPMLYEPCGLPCKIGQRYGALPIGHDTGGIHDALTHLDLAADCGNGFAFETFDTNGLLWAIEQAMAFHRLPIPVKGRQVARIMTESMTHFDEQATARAYLALYQRMLMRPFKQLQDPAASTSLQPAA
jgi:starch synthase